MLRITQLSMILLIFLSHGVMSSSHNHYAYPIENPYAATIIGTPQAFKAKLPSYQQIPVEEYTLKIPGSREIPEIFWYERHGLRYAITSTGSGHRSEKMRLFQRAFYQAGFHVITISSPTVSNFILNASTTAIPGNLKQDSADLYKVMQLIKDKHTDLEVSDYYLIGYSLGASQAAFVSQYDEQQKTFQFKKVMMINPPLNLFNSVVILDKMLEDNVPGRFDSFNDYFNHIINNVTSYHKTHKKINLMNSDFFYNAYKERNPSDYNMQTLIGLAFRMSSSNMIFVSDVFNNLGYLVSTNTTFTKTSSLTAYSKSSRRVGLSDYVNEIYVPYFTRTSGMTQQQVIDASSLLSIKNYLQQSDKIAMMHNENDPILKAGEIEQLKSLFPNRAKVYPSGGHCGNMEYKDNVAYMIGFFKGDILSEGKN